MYVQKVNGNGVIIATNAFNRVDDYYKEVVALATKYGKDHYTSICSKYDIYTPNGSELPVKDFRMVNCKQGVITGTAEILGKLTVETLIEVLTVLLTQIPHEFTAVTPHGIIKITAPIATILCAIEYLNKSLVNK